MWLLGLVDVKVLQRKSNQLWLLNEINLEENGFNDPYYSWVIVLPRTLYLSLLIPLVVAVSVRDAFVKVSD